MTEWQPGSSRAALTARAALFAQIRGFFEQRGVLEVDTPVLARFGVSDPGIEPILARASQASSQDLFLQTSPEFAMKRLLAAGSGPIYQLGKAFRDGEVGSRHNPEFTLLEWYRPGFGIDELIQEVGELACLCLDRGSWSTRSYQSLFESVLGIDPWRVSDAQLSEIAGERVAYEGPALDRNAYLDLLLTHAIEPTLAEQGLVFVVDYPPSQAALARCEERSDRTVAARFELYVDGVELANGYRELLDADELERRSMLDNESRSAAGTETRDLDSRLIDAMRHGLPDCSGVALGVDRLLMLKLGVEKLDQVLAFSWHRC